MIGLSSASVGEMDVPQGFEMLGYGPTATGAGPGWSMSSTLFAQCPRCGDLMSLDPAETLSCRCGGLHKDADAGRFGSSDSDSAIAVFQRSPS